MKKITVKDVAEATGYSQRSVYAALSNSRDASPKAKQIIQEKAIEMGYSVDPVFSELGRRRGRGQNERMGANLVFFLSEMQRHHFESEEDQMKAHANRKGYGLSFVDVAQFKSVEQANRQFKAQGVRGIAAAFLYDIHSAEFITQLDVRHMAVIGGELNHKVFHTVTWNWAEMVSGSIEALVQRGYKKISILFYEDDPLQFYDEQRIGAVYAMKRKHPIQIEFHPVLIQRDQDSSVEDQVRCILEQIVKQDRPEAIIGWSDGHYWMLKKMGFSMPEDFGYVSLISGDDSSGMESPSIETCLLKIDRLIELIRNQELGRPESPIISLYTPKFIDRGTA